MPIDGQVAGWKPATKGEGALVMPFDFDSYFHLNAHRPFKDRKKPRP